MNPQYNEEEQSKGNKGEKAGLFALSLVDDLVIAGIMVGGVAALTIGKKFGKIVGNIPGWAKSQAERFTRSDFRAGFSYFPRVNKATMFLAETLGRKGIISATLAGSLLFGSVAEAHNIVPVGKEAAISVRAQKLKGMVEHIAVESETDPIKRENLTNWLYETSIHESGKLTHRRQLITEKYKVWDVKAKKWKTKKRLVERGRARSIMGMEPRTAEDLVKWAGNNPMERSILAAESGIAYKKLAAMSSEELSNLLMQHDHFAAALSVTKASWIKHQFKAEIPGTIGERAVYTARRYYAGPKQNTYIRQYLQDNREVAAAVKASALSNVIKKHVETKPVQGLVNNVLHERKIMHNVSSNIKKTSSMWRIFGRR